MVAVLASRNIMIPPPEQASGVRTFNFVFYVPGTRSTKYLRYTVEKIMYQVLPGNVRCSQINPQTKTKDIMTYRYHIICTIQQLIHSNCF